MVDVDGAVPQGREVELELELAHLQERRHVAPPPMAQDDVFARGAHHGALAPRQQDPHGRRDRQRSAQAPDLDLGLEALTQVARGSLADERLQPARQRGGSDPQAG